MHSSEVNKMENKMIKNVKIALKAINDVDDYSNWRFNVVRYNLKILYNDLEEDYQKHHKIGSYRGE